MDNRKKRVGAEVGSGTPGPASARHGKPPLGSKRHKLTQLTLAGYVQRTPYAEETPVLKTGAGGAWGSTAQKKLAGLKLRSEQKHGQPTGSKAAPSETQGTTQFRPEAQDEEDDDCGDFIISQSQTYERNQPEPTDAYFAPDQDDLELSLRRTQHYQATQSTQPYSQQGIVQHGGLLHPAASLDGWVVDCTREGSSITVLPPCALEGQGSNQPGAPRPSSAATSTAVGVSMRAQDFHNPTEDYATLAFLMSSDVPLGQAAVLPTTSTGPAVTPELQGPGSSAAVAGDTDVQDDGTTPPLGNMPCSSSGGNGTTSATQQDFFRIFFPTRGQKPQRIFLIRHGESTYNAACRHKADFSEVNHIFDAQLTIHGRNEAQGIRSHVERLMQKHGEPLFVLSPLSRAIETFLNMLPSSAAARLAGPSGVAADDDVSHLQHERDQRGAAGSCRAEPQRGPRRSSAASAGSPMCSPGATAAAQAPLNVVFNPDAAELLHTTGDVGRPKSELVARYPQVASHLARDLPCERWWYEEDRKPNCASKQVFSAREPTDKGKSRVARFQSWLRSREERFVIVVGHAAFFRSLTGRPEYMKNCEVVEWKYN